MYRAVAEIFSFIYDLSNNKNKLDERLKEKTSNRNWYYYKIFYTIIVNNQK